MRIKLVDPVMEGIKTIDKDVWTGEVEHKETNPPIRHVQRISAGGELSVYEFCWKLDGIFVYRKVETLTVQTNA